MVARENKGGPFRNITKVVSQQRPIKIVGQLEILLIKYSALAYKAVICFVSYALIYIITQENCNYFTMHDGSFKTFRQNKNGKYNSNIILSPIYINPTQLILNVTFFHKNN